MDERKEYWIRLFVKKCTVLSKSQEQLDFYFKWCSQTYNVTDSYLSDLKKKHTVDEYINRLIPIIDKYFSIDELKEIIKFYSTEAGKKLIDHNFLQELEKIGVNMNMQIEQDFAMGNNKNG